MDSMQRPPNPLLNQVPAKPKIVDLAAMLKKQLQSGNLPSAVPTVRGAISVNTEALKPYVAPTEPSPVVTWLGAGAIVAGGLLLIRKFKRRGPRAA